MSLARAIPCLRCGAEYSIPGRLTSHYCVPCRTTRRRERDTAHRRHTRAANRAALAGLDVDESTKATLADYLPTLDEYAASYDDAEKRLTVDRMPAGANSPRGPDEGLSTRRDELRGMLKTLADRAAANEWWDANPHWSVSPKGLHDDAAEAPDWLARDVA